MVRRARNKESRALHLVEYGCRACEPAAVHCVANGVTNCIRLAVPQPTKRQQIGNQINAAMIFARADFVNVLEDVNSMVDEIAPGQPFLRVNILRWREIFGMIETPSCNVDLIGAFVVLIGQRRSTPTAKRPVRSRLRPISARRSFHELEL
jgi:hypothetical protein